MYHETRLTHNLPLEQFLDKCVLIITPPNLPISINLKMALPDFLNESLVPELQVSHFNFTSPKNILAVPLKPVLFRFNACSFLKLEVCMKQYGSYKYPVVREVANFIHLLVKQEKDLKFVGTVYRLSEADPDKGHFIHHLANMVGGENRTILHRSSFMHEPFSKHRKLFKTLPPKLQAAFLILLANLPAICHDNQISESRILDFRASKSFEWALLLNKYESAGPTVPIGSAGNVVGFLDQRSAKSYLDGIYPLFIDFFRSYKRIEDGITLDSIPFLRIPENPEEMVRDHIYHEVEKKLSFQQKRDRSLTTALRAVSHEIYADVPQITAGMQKRRSEILEMGRNVSALISHNLWGIKIVPKFDESLVVPSSDEFTNYYSKAIAFKIEKEGKINTMNQEADYILFHFCHFYNLFSLLYKMF